MLLRELLFLSFHATKLLLLGLVMSGCLPYPDIWRQIYMRLDLSLLAVGLVQPLREQTRLPAALLGRALSLLPEAHLLLACRASGGLAAAGWLDRVAALSL